MLYAFLLLNSSSPVLSLGLYSCCFGLSWPISSLSGFFDPFYSFRHTQPVSFPWASPTHSNPSFPWAFAKSFGLPRPKLPYPLLSEFICISTKPYLLNSFLWPPSAHSCLLSIYHNAYGFTTSFFGPACFLWCPFAILQAYGPLFQSFGLNGFLLNLLIFLLYFLPHCWASSYYWVSLPKWASTC